MEEDEMKSLTDYTRQAQRIPYEEKKKYLLSLPETELHHELKALFEKMEEGDLVEITQGQDEFGRDLVIKHSNAWQESFIGIIAKKGNKSGRITGDTAGEVDEIISQIGQAISHPCPLKEIHSGIVNISEIRVIFVGTLTNPAVWRVENEIKEAFVNTFCLGWLIDKFTEHYPEFFFQGRLAEYLREQLLELETKREFAIRPSPLSDSFVNPTVSEIEPPSSLTEAVIDTFRTRRLPFTELETIIGETKRIIIMGDPGTGKSTALNKIALDMFEKCIEVITSKGKVEYLEIPLLLKARDLVSKNMEEYIESTIPAEPLRTKLRIKTLLIDGLDEIKIGERLKVITDLEEYCNNYKCGLVITTRKVEAIKEVIVPFKQYELLPFEYKQAIDFLKRAIKDRELLQIIDEGLKRAEIRMSLTPLALELLIEIATIEREIPAYITEIFERFTDNVLGKYDTAKGVDFAFQYHIKKKFLAELAWQEFFLKDRLVIPYEDFSKFIEQYKQHYRSIKDKLDQFLVEIERAGILSIGEIVFFRHRSFLEFFTAFRLENHRGEPGSLDTDIVDTYFDLMWSEVAFYFIGILREIPQPVLMALDKYDEKIFEDKILKLLTGRLLQAGWDTPSDDKLEVMSIALRQVSSIREHLDGVIERQDAPIPAIFTDFFIMGLSEYSFGSRTFADEIMTLCDSLSCEQTWDSTFKCLLLLWANRNRLLPEKTRELANSIITILAKLESKKQLTVQDKYITLFMLEHIEREDTILLKQIKRKLANVKRVYPSEIRRLLPPLGFKGGIRVRGRRRSKRQSK